MSRDELNLWVLNSGRQEFKLRCWGAISMYKMNEAIQLNVMNREIKGCQEAVKEKMTNQQNRKKTKRDIH